MRRWAVALWFLIGCATDKAAVARRKAEVRLARCLEWADMTHASLTRESACAQESVRYCRAAGLEDSCGLDGHNVNAGVGWP